MCLGLFWKAFSTSGPGGFRIMYLKFLIISAAYLVLAVLGIGGLVGLGLMTLAYKFVFSAGWVQALVIGILGGFVGWLLFILVVAGLIQIGMPLA